MNESLKDGKLTQDQADDITAKREEMKTFKESLEGKTDEERKAVMDAKRAEPKSELLKTTSPKNICALHVVVVVTVATVTGEILCP